MVKFVLVYESPLLSMLFRYWSAGTYYCLQGEQIRDVSPAGPESHVASRDEGRDRRNSGVLQEGCRVLPMIWFRAEITWQAGYRIDAWLQNGDRRTEGLSEKGE